MKSSDGSLIARIEQKIPEQGEKKAKITINLQAVYM